MTIDTFFYQRTIARPAAISGVGVHTGKTMQLHLLPAPVNSGIRFRRTDAGGVEIPALASSVCSLELATCLGRDDITISTVEHLLAAVQVMGVDNLIVEIDGPEIPILDGSSRPFLHLLEAAGVVEQPALRRILAVTKPVDVQIDDKRITASPYPGLRISYTIDFGSDTAIGEQSIDLEIDRESFEKQLAGARTFALERDVGAMRQAGLGLGGNADNCVLYDEVGPVNTELRYQREPVRHKALDAVGDLALLGCPIWAHVDVYKGGHLVHFRLIEELKARPDCWVWMQAEPALAEDTRSPWVMPHPFERPQPARI